MQATDRNAVSAAADAIDRQFIDDASNKGSELREGLRSLLAPPLKAIFTVREDDRIAEVLRVRRI